MPATVTIEEPEPGVNASSNNGCTRQSLTLILVTLASSVELAIVDRMERMPDERTAALDEIASTLDELKTMVEELAEDPPSGVRRDGIEALKQVIEKARDIADDLEDQSP